MCACVHVRVRVIWKNILMCVRVYLRLYASWCVFVFVSEGQDLFLVLMKQTPLRSEWDQQ